MADNSQTTPDSTGMPAPKKVAPAPVLFTPAAAHITARPRAKFIETVKNYKFAGYPRPELAELCQRVALELAEIGSCATADQLEGRVEISGASAHQVLVQVCPHNY